jgi:hypothetical protein
MKCKRAREESAAPRADPLAPGAKYDCEFAIIRVRSRQSGMPPEYKLNTVSQILG